MNTLWARTESTEKLYYEIDLNHQLIFLLFYVGTPFYLLFYWQDTMQCMLNLNFS